MSYGSTSPQHPRTGDEDGMGLYRYGFCLPKDHGEVLEAWVLCGTKST